MTLVLLHPAGLDGDCWRFLAPSVLDGAVRYDLLWHGARGRPGVPLTLEAMADDIAASIPGELDLVGLSLGGAVVQRLALRHPDRVRSALIAGSSPGGAGGAVLEARARAIEQDGIEPIVAPTLERWFSEPFLRDPGHPALVYTKERLLSDDPEGFAMTWRALAANDTIAELPSLRIPVSVVHADGDQSATVETQRAMAEAIPGSRFDVIPGPHMVQLEQPDIFSRAIRDHLDWADSVLEGAHA